MTLNKQKVAAQLVQDYEYGNKFKQGRVPSWKRIEDLYYGRVKKTTKGQFNVPFPVMSGFVDTLHSKIDEKTIVKFKERSEALQRTAKKTQSFWDAQSSDEESDFASVDLNGKKLAILSGRCIARVFGESEPKFNFNLRLVDHYDFYIDPMTRGGIETAKYMGEDGVFLSRSQLVEGANSGLYDAKEVDILINGQTENQIKDTEDQYRNKSNRLNALGLESQGNNYQGDGMTKFIESGTTVNGQRVYALWNLETRLIIRLEPWEKMFKSGKWAWKSYATHEDEFNFWSKGPCDDMMPIAESINIAANQELTNRYRRNLGQRAYDPAVFPNASQLEFRPDGLVATAHGASNIRNIGAGIYQFETPELNGTINLIDWMDNFAGQKSGVNAASQGNADEQKVGIYQGNMAQIADRLGLINKGYTKFWRSVARAFVWACKEHLTEPVAIRMVGETGVEWDTLKAKEIDPDVNILVESGSSELQANDIKKQRRMAALASITADPNLAAIANASVRLEYMLLAGDFTEEEVRQFMDTNTTGNRTEMAKAAEAIDEILKNKKPPLYRGATTAFQQKIINFALDNTDNDLDLYMRLMTYSEAHDTIVEENVMREAMRAGAKSGVPPVQGEPPMSNQPQMSMSQQPAM